MILTDGFLIYPQFTTSEFITESLTWENTNGLIGVICDNQTTAISLLSNDIITLNDISGREIRVFDGTDGTITYQQTERDRIVFHTDRIFEWMWREFAVKAGKTSIPAQNVQDSISYEFIKKDAIINDYIALFFRKISIKNELDQFASEIELDHTYEGYSEGNVDHKQFRRNLSRYYIYNQAEDKIYDFKTY